MSFTIEKFENEPIFIVKIHQDYEVEKHQSLSDKAARAILDASSETLYHIVDITDFRLSFNDVIAAANQGARGKDAAWHHPKNKMLIFISTNPLVKAAAAGLASAAFGHLQAKAFSTLEEALTWIRAQ